MDMLVNLLALVLIGFIIGWFWLIKPQRVRQASESIDILVDGGVYSPATIEIAGGQPVTLNFIRRDASPCAEKVIFPDLDISADLPLAETKTIPLQVDKKGEFEFTCQMGMYRGKLIVT